MVEQESVAMTKENTLPQGGLTSDDGIKIEKVLARMVEQQELLLARQDDFDHSMSTLKLQITGLTAAFPNGDSDSHRRYHEAVMEDVTARKRLTQAILEKTVSGLLWSFVLAIGYAIWNELKRRLGLAH